MQAVFYERVGAAADVLQYGELPDPVPAAGEVRVRVQWSGVNPSDVKSRAGLRSRSLPFPRVIPHSDGMGVIDSVGAMFLCITSGTPGTWVEVSVTAA